MPSKRLPAEALKAIRQEHILLAIRDLDNQIQHAFADSTGFDLVHRGRRYPPKAVFGVAGRYALGRELLPEHFSGGEDSVCFQVLRQAGFEVVPKERAFLLTWNPEHFPLDQFRDLLIQHEEGDEGITWSTGPRKEIPVGSKLFLMRLGMEPKGIVGIAISTERVRDLPHWDPERQKRGITAHYVPLRFSRIQEEPFLPLAVLEERWPEMDWTPQSSGIEIHNPSVISFINPTELERPILPEEVTPAEEHLEGAVTQVTVNAYERDPSARRKCLAHHGYKCAVCEKSMGDIYGPIAEGIIHVHHRRPLHTIGKKYKVDPIRDLVPVCPNCHAVLHRQQDAMTVEDLRSYMGIR